MAIEISTSGNWTVFYDNTDSEELFRRATGDLRYRVFPLATQSTEDVAADYAVFYCTNNVSQLPSDILTRKFLRTELRNANENPVATIADAAGLNTFLSSVTGNFRSASGSGAGVSPDHIFTGAGTDANDYGPAETARDTYFTTNSDELIAGVLVVVVNTFPDPDVAREELYTGTEWVTTDTILSPQQISDLLYSLADRNPLTNARAATVDAITDTGRGQIITTAEAGEIDDSYSSSSLSDNVITFTKNDASTDDVTLRRGLLQYADIEFSANLNISVATLPTYQNRTVINTGTDVVLSFNSIATFVAAATEDFFITFVNEDTTDFTIGSNAVNSFAGRRNITLEQGNSVTIKYPGGGAVWDIIGGSGTQSGGTNPAIDPTLAQIPSGVVRYVLDGSNDIITFDASSGAFPAGSSAGFIYPVSTAGTVDSEPFENHDTLLSMVDSASTDTFADNWRRLDGDENVRSWGGLSGVVSDDQIINKLRLLGFENTATITNLALTDIASRIDTTTSLVGDHVITFNITAVRSVSTLILNLNSVAIDTITVSNLVEGSNTVTTNISTTEWADIVTTPNLLTLPFRLTGTTSEGTAITSNIVNVERRDIEDHENFYYGRETSTADPTTIDIDTLTAIEITGISGQEITFTIPAGNDNDKIILLAPADRDITALVNTGTGLSVLSVFTKVENDRVINTENFDSYELDALRSGFTASYRATL